MIWTHTQWLNRNRAADEDIDWEAFNARCHEDDRIRRHAFIVQMFTLGLVLGVLGGVWAHSWWSLTAPLLLFLFYGWKAWT